MEKLQAKDLLDYKLLSNGILSADGRHLAFLVSICQDDPFKMMDEIPFWSDGQGIVNKKRNRLYLFDLNKQELKPISDPYSNVEFYNYSNSRILFTTSTYTDKKKFTTALYQYDLDNETCSNLLEDDIFNIVYVGYINDKIVIAGSDMGKFGFNENPNFYLIEEGKIKSLANYEYNFANKISLDTKYGQGITYKVYQDHLYFLSTVGTSTHIKRLSIHGDIETVLGDGWLIASFDISDSGIYLIGHRNGKLQEVYLYKDEEDIQLTEFNQTIIKTKTISPIEKVYYQSDGWEMEGSVIKPRNFDTNKKYPGVLFIHGGPKSTYGEVFHHNMHCLSNEGYFVFYTNPRGSDGRGNEFADIVGKQGTIDYNDIMRFTDAVLEKYPNIDSDRLGVTGRSYGGFMTNWIIGHNDKFKCAVSESGIANWISKITTTDIGYHFNAIQMGATPWTNPEKLWDHSPMKYADKIQAPTLFIHPGEDYRCWMAEGVQMFLSLKYHGVESKLLIVEGESHGLDTIGRPKQRIKRIEEMLKWFNKYLKK